MKLSFRPVRRPVPTLDRTGPATAYPNRSGALGPAAVREIPSRRDAASRCYPKPERW